MSVSHSILLPQPHPSVFGPALIISGRMEINSYAPLMNLGDNLVAVGSHLSPFPFLLLISFFSFPGNISSSCWLLQYYCTLLLPWTRQHKSIHSFQPAHPSLLPFPSSLCLLPVFFPRRYDNYSRPSNPFLVPLTKYLDRYATETMDYFLEKERLGKSSFAGLLVRGERGACPPRRGIQESGVLVLVEIDINFCFVLSVFALFYALWDS